MGKFNETDLQKAYAWEQGKDYETASIESRSCQIRSKIQAWKKTASSSGLNIATTKDPSITSAINQESAEDEDASLLGR